MWKLKHPCHFQQSIAAMSRNRMIFHLVLIFAFVQVLDAKPRRHDSFVIKTELGKNYRVGAVNKDNILNRQMINNRVSRRGGGGGRNRFGKKKLGNFELQMDEETVHDGFGIPNEKLDKNKNKNKNKNKHKNENKNKKTKKTKGPTATLVLSEE